MMKEHPAPFLACLPLAAVITATLFVLAEKHFRLETAFLANGAASRANGTKVSAYNQHARLVASAPYITTAP